VLLFLPKNYLQLFVWREPTNNRHGYFAAILRSSIHYNIFKRPASLPKNTFQRFLQTADVVVIDGDNGEFHGTNLNLFSKNLIFIK